MAILTLLLSLAALGLSIFATTRQDRSARNAQSISVILELIGEFRKPEMVQARRQVLSGLEAGSSDPAMGYNELPDQMRASVLLLSHYYDHVGLLVAHRLIDADAIFGLSRRYDVANMDQADAIYQRRA
jgi:hypothetical protein